MSHAEKLLAVLGRDAMQKLCDEFGGERIYIPLRLPDPNRDDRILTTFYETLHEGATTMSAYETASAESSLSVRRVQQIVACRI